jgi:flagellin
MIQSTGSVASLLSEIYQSNTSSLNTSLSRIASGKRVQSASDDFSSYMKAAQNSTYISQYQQYNRSLQVAKSASDYMVATGNAVLDSLNKLRDNREQYAGTTDTNQIAALNAQFTAIKTQMDNLISNANFEGAAAYTAGEVSNASATIGGATYAVNVTAGTVAATVALTDTGATIAAQITAGETYLANVQAIQDRIVQQTSINNTIISSYGATNSVLTDVNEADEMSKITNLQVRQQATASMMSQANSSAAAIAKLFQ